MFKLVRKKITEIKFFDNRAVLKAKGFGKFAIWFSLIWGGMCILVGIGSSLIFTGLGIILIASTFLFPFYEWVEFNQDEQKFKYFKGTFRTKEDPDRAKVKTYSFRKLTIDWESVRQFGSVTILIQARDGARFLLTMPAAKHAALIEWLSENRSVPQPETSVDIPNSDGIPLANKPVASLSLYQQKDAMGHATMLKEISSWGRSMLILGVVHLIVSGFLSPGWGITLLAIGGLSFLFKEAAMFILYAVTLIWVGISNSLSLGFGFWTLFGLFQIYLGVMMFQKYRRYRDYEREHLSTLEQVPSDISVGRAAKLFPWLGAVLSGLGLLVYVGAWAIWFVAVATSLDAPDGSLSDSFINTLGLVVEVVLGLGVIGFGLSLSSVVSKYKPRILAWAGVVFGSLLVLVETGLGIWLVVSG